MSREPDRNPRKVLGKGLSALLPSRTANAATAVAPAEAPVGPIPVRDNTAASDPKHGPKYILETLQLPENFEDFQNIALDKIQSGEEQPRDQFDAEKLQELAQSIRANGVLQPIVVYRDERAPGRFRIIAGERRWRAARLAGLKEIPALVRTVERNQLLELSLIENIQREDLNAIEIAIAFERLSTQHNMSHEQIAERTGKDRSTVTNFLRLLRLSAKVQDELRRGAISMGHARALLNVVDEEKQAELCAEVIRKKLSVREVESLVKRFTQSVNGSQTIDNKAVKKVDPNIRAALEELGRVLGTRVSLVPGAGQRGRLVIEYYSQDDLDRIYTAIVQS
jgi:ParB family transcriptional regulator, chromosome partitioning protein